MEGTGKSIRDDKVKISILLNFTDYEGLNIYNASSWSDPIDKYKYDNIKQSDEEYFVSKKCL